MYATTQLALPDRLVTLGLDPAQLAVRAEGDLITAVILSVASEDGAGPDSS